MGQNSIKGKKSSAEGQSPLQELEVSPPYLLVCFKKRMTHLQSFLHEEEGPDWWCLPLFWPTSVLLTLILTSISIVFPRVFCRLSASAGVSIEVSLLTGVTWPVRDQASASPFSSTWDTTAWHLQQAWHTDRQTDTQTSTTTTPTASTTTDLEKSQFFCIQWFCWMKNFRKKVQKPKLQLIITKVRIFLISPL